MKTTAIRENATSFLRFSDAEDLQKRFARSSDFETSIVVDDDSLCFVVKIDGREEWVMSGKSIHTPTMD